MKIVLIGFMGTGKTETGRLLARELRLDFIDTDQVVEQAVGLPVDAIFERYGEVFFRTREAEVVRTAGRRRGVVIAAGGGAVLDPVNRRELFRAAVTVALCASPEEIMRRTAGGDSRPLLRGGDAPRTIRRLLDERLPCYREALIRLDTDGKTPREVSREIRSAIAALRLPAGSGSDTKPGEPS